MNPSIIQLAKEKGFVSQVIGKSVDAIHSKKPFYYLWLCEVHNWLVEDNKVLLQLEYDELAEFWSPRVGYDLLDDYMYENYNGASLQDALEVGVNVALKTLKQQK